jgi:hypothetical protein
MAQHEVWHQPRDCSVLGDGTVVQSECWSKNKDLVVGKVLTGVLWPVIMPIMASYFGVRESRSDS